MNAVELNRVLQGKTIKYVEEGTTPGWIIVEFTQPGEALAAEPPAGPDGTAEVDFPPGKDRLFLTIFVGGRVGSGDSEHYALSGLHVKSRDGTGYLGPIRDGRDPLMLRNADGWEDWLRHGGDKALDAPSQNSMREAIEKYLEAAERASPPGDAAGIWRLLKRLRGFTQKLEKLEEMKAEAPTATGQQEAEMEMDRRALGTLAQDRPMRIMEFQEKFGTKTAGRLLRDKKISMQVSLAASGEEEGR